MGGESHEAEEIAYLRRCLEEEDREEIEEPLPCHPFSCGITFPDSVDDSHGENNNESVPVNRFILLISWKFRKESLADGLPQDARTFLISRTRARLFVAHSSGITFIFVRAKKSICVVSRDKSEDMEQFVLYLDDILARYQGCFKEGLEVEPLAAATLSVGAGKVNKPASPFPGLRKAVHFLRDRLRSNLAFTYEEIVQTAISALVRLYGEDLKANDIQVRVIKEWGRSPESLDVGEIEEHISCVQGHEQPNKLQCTERMKELRSQQSSSSVSNHQLVSLITDP